MGMRKLYNKLPDTAKAGIKRYCEKLFFSSDPRGGNQSSRHHGPLGSAEHKIYGSIYSPLYNLSAPMLHDEPPAFYNQDGRRMDIFFLRDVHFSDGPYTYSKHFEFDRFNWGLKTHFYSHKSMLETMGNPDRRYGFFCESEAIVPADYKIFQKHPGLEKDFDLIFTYSAALLDALPNARFVPFCATLWVGENHGDIISDDAHSGKKKNISILSSDKIMCEMHKLRLKLARKCKAEGLADTFGTFDGGARVSMGSTLCDYRYSIAIENDLAPFFFTERLTSCFAAMTVPIYLGASEIDRFFNPDGIIKISIHDLDNIENILAQCSERDYESRLDAIKDNYERAKWYMNIWEHVYEDYLAPAK